MRRLRLHLLSLAAVCSLLFTPLPALAAPYGTGSYSSQTYSSAQAGDTGGSTTASDVSGSSGGSLANTGQAIGLASLAAFSIGVLSIFVVRLAKRPKA